MKSPDRLRAEVLRAAKKKESARLARVRAALDEQIGKTRATIADSQELLRKLIRERDEPN